MPEALAEDRKQQRVGDLRLAGFMACSVQVLWCSGFAALGGLGFWLGACRVRGFGFNVFYIGYNSTAGRKTVF